MSDIALPLLDRVEIASPCPAKWEHMKGDAVTRRCGQCDHEVHNLSAMTAQEAEVFLRERAGQERVCARLYRRADGTVLTRDCPVGIALWRKRARFAAGRVAAAVLFLVTGGFIASAKQREAREGRLRQAEPFRTVCEWANPTVVAPVPPVPPRFIIGFASFGGGPPRPVAPQPTAEEQFPNAPWEPNP